MAAFGGGGAGGGGGQGGKGPWQRGGDGAGLPGLIPGFPGAAPPGAGGPPPFVQGIPGLAGHLPPGHPGAANPVVTMAGQPVRTLQQIQQPKRSIYLGDEQKKRLLDAECIYD